MVALQFAVKPKSWWPSRRRLVAGAHRNASSKSDLLSRLFPTSFNDNVMREEEIRDSKPVLKGTTVATRFTFLRAVTCFPPKTRRQQQQTNPAEHKIFR